MMKKSILVLLAVVFVMGIAGLGVGDNSPRRTSGERPTWRLVTSW